MNKGMSVTIDLSFCLVSVKGFAASGNNSGCTCGPGGYFSGWILHHFGHVRYQRGCTAQGQGEAAKLLPDPGKSKVQLCSGAAGRKWEKANRYNFPIVKFPKTFGIATFPRKYKC